MGRSKLFRPGPKFVIKSTKVFINHLKGKNRKGQSKLECLIQYPLAVPFFSSLVSPTPVPQILYSPDLSFLPSLEECGFLVLKVSEWVGILFLRKLQFGDMLWMLFLEVLCLWTENQLFHSLLQPILSLQIHTSSPKLATSKILSLYTPQNTSAKMYN